MAPRVFNEILKKPYSIPLEVVVNNGRNKDVESTRRGAGYSTSQGFVGSSMPLQVIEAKEQAKRTRPYFPKIRELGCHRKRSSL